MTRRLVLTLAIAAAALMATGDVAIHAARCTPSGQGKCSACKNCKSCRNCAKQGGTCSVCR